jgi:hypothetical protein
MVLIIKYLRQINTHLCKFWAIVEYSMVQAQKHRPAARVLPVRTAIASASVARPVMPLSVQIMSIKASPMQRIFFIRIGVEFPQLKVEPNGM